MRFGRTVKNSTETMVLTLVTGIEAGARLATLRIVGGVVVIAPVALSFQGTCPTVPLIVRSCHASLPKAHQSSANTWLAGYFQNRAFGLGAKRCPRSIRSRRRPAARS